MTLGGPPDPRAGARASRTRGAFARRRTVFLFVAAGAAVVLALTTRFWLPALPTLFGVVQANRELIGAFADLTTVATFAILVIGAVLAYLGFRSIQTSDDEQRAQQSMVVDRGGRGAAIGDANRGTVIVGDHNQVEIHRGVTYSYSEVEPSSPDPAVLEGARRQLETLPLEDLAARDELLPRSVIRLRPNRHFVGRR